MERGVGLLGRDSRTSPPPTRWDLGSAPMKYQVRARNPEAFSCTCARTVWLSTGGLICLVPPEGRDVCKPFRLWHWEGLKGGVAPDLKPGRQSEVSGGQLACAEACWRPHLPCRPHLPRAQCPTPTCQPRAARTTVHGISLSCA